VVEVRPAHRCYGHRQPCDSSARPARGHLRDQFLSTASHELRTPITSLKLTIESLIHGTRSGPLPAAHSRRMQRVLHSTKRLEHLVNELLDVTRIE
jgi:signal transduction histidine kinase